MTKIILVFASSWLLIFAHQAVFSTSDPVPPILWLENATASAVAWSPDGTQLAVGDAAGISIYTRDLQFIRFMEQPSGQMKTLQWSPDGLYLAAGSGNDVEASNNVSWRENDIFIWNSETGNLVTRFTQHKNAVPSLAWSPVGDRIATGSWDRTIRIWDPLTGEIEYVLNAPREENYTNEVMSMDWSSDGQLAAIIGDIGLYLWTDFDQSPETLILSTGRTPPENAPGYAEWSPSRQFISLGGSAYYDLERHTENYPTNCVPAGLGVDWSPNEGLVAFFAWYQQVLICDPFKDTIIVVLQGSMVWSDPMLFGYQDSLDWSPDGTLLAGAAGDGYVRIWDVSSLIANQT